jgi:hypothetical protein
MHIQLTPYQPTHDLAIAKLEDSIVQGKGIRLKILKNHFLDRCMVFPKTFPCLALNEANEVIATAVGAETKIMINRGAYTAGYVLDAKVHSSYRNKGIGTQLAKQQKAWFRKQGWEKNFTTLKLSNAAVIKLSAKAVGSIWLKQFVYLTIPTSIRIPSTVRSVGSINFSVQLFEHDNLPSAYYTTFSGGLGVFHTWMLYRLKIEKLSWLHKQGLDWIKKLSPKKYALLPKEKEIMEFGTLFNHSMFNIESINEVMQHMQADGKAYLLVCCCEGDDMYNYLHRYSVNTYNYYILADFPLLRQDIVSVDVRCL